MLEVRPVAERRALHRFVDLPWRLHAGSAWVPPLRSDVLGVLDPVKNPFFRHSTAALFLAERDGEAVGRIAAIENRRHLETYRDSTGFFGFFESVDDPEVAAALFDRAAAWLTERGLRRLRGPTSFTINDESGLLLDAFDLPPVVGMSYNPPYYPGLVEGYGFTKAQDLLAFRLRPAEVPARLAAARPALACQGIVLRPIRLRRLDEEVRRIHQVHSQAWAGNWGAVPLTDGELRWMAGELRRIADPDLVLIAEHHGRPVGISVTIPDANQVLRHLNGRLFPTGFLRWLWWSRRKDALRVLALGVLEGYRRRGLDAAMVAETISTGLRKGYRWAEMSWILESNLPMRRLLARLGAEAYKTYRIYDLDL
ncbi:MAG: N-acetyltransferase family protein [Thermoanaerobaculia bacterium]